MISQHYSNLHYKTVTTSKDPLFITDLIASYSKLFYSLSLTDPCVLPKKHQPASDNTSKRKMLLHGDGLFGISYNDLDHYVYIFSENTLVMAEVMPAINCLPAKDSVLFVCDVCFSFSFLKWILMYRQQAFRLIFNSKTRMSCTILCTRQHPRRNRSWRVC